jgi:hypothetical protein
MGYDGRKDLYTDGCPKRDFFVRRKSFDHKENPEHLKWLHMLISNAKAFISGTYHGLDDIHFVLSNPLLPASFPPLSYLSPVLG